MKIAIASNANSTDGEISERAGRAPYYLIFDDKGSMIEAIKNPFATGGGGAGYGVAKMLRDKNVEKVIVGKAGGNMKIAMDEMSIELIEKEGLIKDALGL